MDNVKVLLFQSSRTQRVTLTKLEDGAFLLSKEWRRGIDEPWIQGKGIKLPVIGGISMGERLGMLLASGMSGDIIAEQGLEYIEDEEGVEKSDFSEEKTHNWTTNTHYEKTSMGGRVH